MISTLISFDRRAMRAVSLAVVTAALAACDTDSPLEPTTRATGAMPGAPQANIVAAPSGVLAWSTVHALNTQIFLGGATFQVSGGRFLQTVVDNGANDGDLAVGKFKLTGLAAGTYTLCELVPPTDYSMPSPSCRQVAVYAKTTTTVQITHLSLPSAQVDVRYQKSTGSVPVAGSSMWIRAGGPTGPVVKTIIDNGASDRNPTPGMFDFFLPAPGTYSICITNPPTGYFFVGPYVDCYTWTFEAGKQMKFYGWYVKPIQY